MRKKNKLIFGVGINNADYIIQKFENIGYTDSGKQIRKLMWICPFYRRWASMLARCYNEKYHYRSTYIGCSVIPEWHYFMTFRAWMEKQDWEGKQLDKDLLFPGNKVYSPDTCVFVDKKINLFLTEGGASRGDWSIGVTFDKRSGKFLSQCNDFDTGKPKHLGYFIEPQEAHQAWLAFKLEKAYILAAEQTDPRVAKALIERYENYGKLD